MIADTHVTEITHVIQLAIAPVFLLTAVGTMIGVLSNRLARAVDRIRVVESRLRELSAEDAADAEDASIAQRELDVLARRMRLVYVAIGLAVICALFVSLLIAIAFVDAFLAADLSKVVGLLFIAAMVAFIGSLVVFLREIFLAISTARHLQGK
jgi:ABC-type multidrug transport system fused ATPase/permease subunit